MTPEQIVVPEIFVQVCSDLCREYPGNTMRIARFLLDLNRRLKSRGVERTLCIDFPKLGKIYDKGLSTGSIPYNSTCGVYYGGSNSRKNVGIVPIIELTFRRDVDRWVLRHPADPTLVFYSRTILYLAKKLLREAPNNVKEKGESEFFSLDESVIKRIVLRSKERDILRSVSARFIPLSIPTWDDLRFRHGPGAVADLSLKRKDKYAFPTWTNKLERWFPREEFSNHNYMAGSLPLQNTHQSYREEDLVRDLPPIKIDGIQYSGEELIWASDTRFYRFDRNWISSNPSQDLKPYGKVCSVPKTLDKVRVITVEPTCNQFFQQGLRAFLIGKQTAVASQSIDTLNQELSRAAAKKASIDGSCATVDLKSASDFLSLELFDICFDVNPVLRDMLLACRTDTIINPEGKPVILNKYAGQGNATTFIVQSLIYSILGVTSVILDSGKRPTLRNIRNAAKKVRVFGDDIILPSQNLLTFSRILSSCGLRINSDKTHYTGFFREACGGDYFHGYDVTPFYVKDWDLEKGPEELVSWCAVSNNAYTKGLIGTSLWMQSKKDLPVNSPSAIGYLSRFPFRYSPKRRRWNEDLHRFEFLELTSTNRPRRRESELRYGRLYKYFVEAPSQLVSWDGRLTISTTVSLKRQWVA